MILTNTLFNHKKCHRTIWTAPDRITDHNHHDGNRRRNLPRDQIDYILIKSTFRRLVHDYKAVIMNMKLDWWKMTKKSVKNSVTVNIEKSLMKKRRKNARLKKKHKQKLNNSICKIPTRNGM